MQKGVHRSQLSKKLSLRRGIFMPRWMHMLLCSAGFTLALTACSLDGGSSNSARGNAPAPGSSSTISRASAVAAAPTPMDTFRAMAKPQGLRFTPLFNEPAPDDASRMKRIETAVQTLRNDFDTVVPSLVRLVAIEKDMREMVAQMQSLTGGPTNSTALPVEAVEQVEIPDEDVTRGTEPVQAPAAAGKRAVTPSSSVTPEAASAGMPPEDAASPVSSQTSVVAPTITPPSVPKATAPASPTPDVAPAAPARSAPVAPAVTPRKAAASEAVVTPAAPVVAKTTTTSTVVQTTTTTPAPAKPASASKPAPAPIKVTPEELEAVPSMPQPKPQAALPVPVTTPAPTTAPAQNVAWNNVFGNTQTTQADTPRPAQSLGSVAEVRIGDHLDKTRIVLDMTTAANVTASLQKEGKQLVIDLPQLDWTGKPSWSAETAALVSGWTYSDGKLYVDLLYPAIVKNQQVLEGNASSLARIVIDLFSKDVHK